MQKRADELTKLLNGSGYLLQLGLEHAILETQQSHHWKVLSREHPWRTAASEGFTDLILGAGAVRLVLECKRPSGGKWLFLSPSPSATTERLCCHLSVTSDGHNQVFRWIDAETEPSGPESSFCIVRGSGEGDRSLLERLAGPLLDAIPALASEELKVGYRSGTPYSLFHVPVIVTTAELQVARFDNAAISLGSGELPAAAFECVPFIRFRKSLAHEISDPKATTSLRVIARDKERSILVVNAAAFTDFLSAFRLHSGSDAAWPGPAPSSA